MKIITLTLNPAFDVYCYAENFGAYRENLAKVISRDAGGKGVNIGRALAAYGINAKNLVVLAEENGEEFARLLSEEGLELVTLSVKGRIRENMTVATDGAPETRISFSGFSAEDSLLTDVLDILATELEEGCIVTFSGRLPGGVSHGAAMAFLKELKARGAKLVLDTHALDREDIIELSPWLIKPNEEELSRYLGKCESIEDIIRAAEKLCESGVENVLVSLGARGAVLVRGDGSFTVNAPSVTVRSTVGAGDSSIAGFISGFLNGEGGYGMLKRAVAFGSAACMTQGTSAPSKEYMDEILEKI